MILTALSLFLTGSLSSPSAPQSPTAGDYFRPVSGALDLDVVADGRPEPLEAVLERYSKLTGQVISLDPGAQRYVDSLNSGVIAPASIPAADVHEFVQSLLVSRKLGVVVVPGDPPSLIIRSFDSIGDPLHVPRRSLDQWVDFPAVYVSSEVVLDHFSAREVIPMREQVSAVPTSRGAVRLSGPAGAVFQLACSLESIDREIGSRQACTFERRTLEFARAAEVSATLRHLLTVTMKLDPEHRTASPESQAARVTIQSSSRTNSVVVVGSAEDVALAMKIITALDVPADEG